MMSRLLFAFRIPALCLSALLQMMPMVRQALPAFQTAGNLMAIIFRWGVGAAAAFGSVQAVSGASTVITTGDVTATNGVPTSTRLLTSPESAGWWSASGLPPGVNLTQNSSRWYLAGTPAATGVYSVTLVAKSSATAGPSETTTKTITFTVVPGSGSSNSPPTANGQSVSTPEDSTRSITLSGSDPDGDSLTYAIINQPGHGTLTGTAPNVRYLPVANYNGSDSFTFRVNDGSLDSSPATVSITVTPVNDAPTATAQTISTAEDTARAITLAGNDVEGSPLTFSIVGQPSHGTLTGTAPDLTYEPAPNYNGSDTFTFRVNDGALDSAAAAVSISISAVNDPPTADAQTVSTPENTARSITLTGSDVEGSPLTYTIVSSPAHGSLSGTAPNVNYTPNATYLGTDSFTFKVSDGSLESAAATVSVIVSSVNSPPVAKAQNVSVVEDIAKPITLSGTDPDGDPLSYTVLTQPSQGVLSGVVPNLTYSPYPNVNGSDSFTFRVNDGAADSAPATVSISIAAVNDPPVATPQTVTTAEDTARAITLSGTDIEGSPLTYALVTPPAHGTLSGAPPNLSYLPAANFNGADSLSFKVNDGVFDSQVATVSITVTPVNDPPVAANFNQSAASGKQVTLNPLSLCSDPDSDPLSIIAVSPTNGTATVSGGSAIVFATSSNFVGTAYVGYSISDGHGGTASGVITLAVAIAPVTQLSVQPGSIAMDPQTGLYDQAVTVQNTGTGTAAAVRLKVEDLRAGVTLYNAAGEEAGVPYVQNNASLNPGQSVTFRLEYYVPDRQPFTSTLSAEPVLSDSSSASAGAGTAIDTVFMDRTNPSDPRFTIEFTTVPGRVYTVIYTDDMVHWKAATPSFTAAATRTQWHDDGPPKTDSKPAGGRFYRVIEQ